MIQLTGYAVDHGFRGFQKRNGAAQPYIHVILFGFRFFFRGNLKSSKTGIRIRYRLRSPGHQFDAAAVGIAFFISGRRNHAFQLFQPLCRKRTDREIFRSKLQKLRFFSFFRFSFFGRQNYVLVLNRICHLVISIPGQGTRHTGEGHHQGQQESDCLFQFKHLCCLLSTYPSVEAGLTFLTILMSGQCATRYEHFRRK